MLLVHFSKFFVPADLNLDTKSASNETVKESKQEVPPQSPSQPFSSANPPFVHPWGMLGQLLSNPNIAMMIPSLLQAFSQTSQNPNGNATPDVETINQMLKNLGLNQQQQEANSNNGNGQVNMQQTQAMLQQLLQSPMVTEFLPTLISSFTQNAQSPQWNHCAPKAEQPSSQSTDELPPVHEGVVCDGCGEGIVGIRYKCSNCADYVTFTLHIRIHFY